MEGYRSETLYHAQKHIQMLHNTLKLQYLILILLFLKKIIDYLPIEDPKKFSALCAQDFVTPVVLHSGRLLPQNNDQILEGY